MNSKGSNSRSIEQMMPPDADLKRNLVTIIRKLFIFKTEAVKALADGNANTVVLPNQTLDSLGLIPALTKVSNNN